MSWRTRTPSACTAAGSSVFGPIDAHFGRAERRQAVDQRARDARMQHVADDRDRELAEILLVVADREQVEQALRRMRMTAVAGIDDVDVRAAGRD